MVVRDDGVLRVSNSWRSFCMFTVSRAAGVARKCFFLILLDMFLQARNFSLVHRVCIYVCLFLLLTGPIAKFHGIRLSERHAESFL